MQLELGKIRQQEIPIFLHGISRTTNRDRIDLMVNGQMKPLGRLHERRSSCKSRLPVRQRRQESAKAVQTSTNELGRTLYRSGRLQ